MQGNIDMSAQMMSHDTHTRRKTALSQPEGLSINNHHPQKKKK